MTIDEPTLMTVLGLASLTSSAIFLALALLARQIPGVALWSLGCFAVGFATVIDGPRLITDWRVASLMFNIPYSLGQACMLAGTLQFCGRRHASQTLAALCIVGIALAVGFTYGLPDTVLRIGSLSAYQVAINLWTAWILLRHPDRFSRTAFRVAAVIAVLQAISSFTQGALIVLSSQTFSYAAPELPIANIASWSGALINTLLGNSVLFLLIMLRLVAELRRAADYDVLTGLLNRRGLRQYIDAILERRTPDQFFAVLMIDVDKFKSVNDTFGHETGDRVLEAMGAVLRDAVVANARACRWGGEEFCVVVHSETRAAAVGLAERIRAGFQAASANVGGLDGICTASVGIGIADPAAPLVVASVFAAADEQLYRAKESGRDRVKIA